MMGERRVDQAALFYEFSLDRHVPADHMLRSIDRFVDLEDLRAKLAAFYSPIGRPSIDPELLIRMLLVGYCFGIRSERRLCEEVHLNLAYRWFCRLGLDGDAPDHSTFSKNRHGRLRESDLLRQLFETVVRRFMAEGLVGGEGFAVDASLIAADANRQRCAPGEQGLPPEAASRAIDEYLAVLDDAAFGAATPVTPKFISPADPAGGLRRLRPQGPVLPQHAGQEGDPLDLRSRARPSSRDRHHRRLRRLEARAEEGGDALRAPEADPEAQPPAAPRASRRPRRGSPRRHRSDPAQTRQAHPGPGQTRLFQRNRSKADIAIPKILPQGEARLRPGGGSWEASSVPA